MERVLKKVVKDKMEREGERHMKVDVKEEWVEEMMEVEEEGKMEVAVEVEVIVGVAVVEEKAPEIWAGVVEGNLKQAAMRAAVEPRNTFLMYYHHFP